MRLSLTKLAENRGIFPDEKRVKEILKIEEQSLGFLRAFIHVRGDTEATLVIQDENGLIHSMERL